MDDLLKRFTDSKLPQSHCAHCKKLFFKTRKWQTFCSDKCRTGKFQQERQESLQRDAARCEVLEKRIEVLEAENKGLRAKLEKRK